MNIGFKHFFFYTILILTVACNGKQKSIDTSKNIKPKTQYNITIYGSENCDHCIAFRKSVDSLGIKYTFYDVEANEQYYNELTRKIQLANYKGYVSFPVLDINEKIYVRPKLEEFMEIIAE